jgi:hypothetical protein
MGMGSGGVWIRIAKMDAPNFASNPVILLQIGEAICHRPQGDAAVD